MELHGLARVLVDLRGFGEWYFCTVLPHPHDYSYTFGYFPRQIHMYPSNRELGSNLSKSEHFNMINLLIIINLLMINR